MKYCICNNFNDVNSNVYIFNFIAHAGYAPITPEKHVLCYLWFVGHQTSSYRDVADRFDVTISALYVIISRVTNFIITLSETILRHPTLQERQVTMN